MQYKTIWDRHLSISDDIIYRKKLKKLGYGLNFEDQERNLKIMEMRFKEKKTLEEIGEHFKISKQAIQVIIARISKRTES